MCNDEIHYILLSFMKCVEISTINCIYFYKSQYENIFIIIKTNKNYIDIQILISVSNYSCFFKHIFVQYLKIFNSSRRKITLKYNLTNTICTIYLTNLEVLNLTTKYNSLISLWKKNMQKNVIISHVHVHNSYYL